jgi:penicillin-binding protein-related factor A (putative recombinase)
MEKDIENEILQYLASKDIFVWKCNNTGVYDATSGIFRKPKNRFHLRGVSDILGVYCGKILAIEVKTPKTKLRTTPEQKIFLSKIIEEGGIAFIAASIEDVERELANQSPVFKVTSIIDERVRVEPMKKSRSKQ